MIQKKLVFSKNLDLIKKFPNKIKWINYRINNINNFTIEDKKL